MVARHALQNGFGRDTRLGIVCIVQLKNDGHHGLNHWKHVGQLQCSPIFQRTIRNDALHHR